MTNPTPCPDCQRPIDEPQTCDICGKITCTDCACYGEDDDRVWCVPCVDAQMEVLPIEDAPAPVSPVPKQAPIATEADLSAALKPIAEEARLAGMFFDAFAIRIYKDGTTGGTHVACNHQGGPLGTSRDAWETIVSGVLRMMEGEEVQDEYPTEDPRSAKPDAN